ncbi:MAG: RecX family transcriptional regulator [Rhodospirillaceae bacterium]|nr:RecX family transcriptional regulator [Rhodospirillaceae bacterium]
MPLSNKSEQTQESSVNTGKACRKQALDLLARREHTRLELKRKLSARAYRHDTIDEVLDKLEMEGLLEEMRFVESFVRTRINKGQGPLRIQADLVQRGVTEMNIRAGLTDACQDWGKLASEVRHKRFGSANPREFSERARQIRFLQYRGFKKHQIDAALDFEGNPD